MGSPIYIQLKGDVKLTPEVLKPSVVYQCDGRNKKFIFPYDFVQIEDIKLTIVDANGTEAVQVGNIDYDETNKTVIYPANGDALAVGNKVILERKTSISQDMDLPDEYPFENIEHATDKIILILQEMKAELDRSLKIRVDSDKNANEVAKDIVERSVKAANDAVNAMNTISEKSDKINANADIINKLGEEIKTIAATVDDKLATANTALDTSSTNVSTAERLVRDAKAYAGQTTVDKRDINELVSQARTLKTDIDNKQTSTASNAIKAADAAKRAETAAARAEEIALPKGAGLVTKTEADAKYQTKDSLYGIVSVKDFGAVGDGVADDTAAFKRANDNLKNKILLVPNGIYKINEHLSFNTVDSVMDMGTYNNVKPFYPTETPMLKGSNNIAFVKNIQYGDEVNQCQGFTYNDKKNVFVLACINSDGTNQIFYELNSSTFEIVGTYKFNDPDKMGHCNTMCYNKNTNKIYLANGLKNGNNLTVLNADTMQYESTITLKEKVFNIGYDPITRTYVSIVPISGQQRLREINLYNDDFKKLKTYQVDYEYDDFNNNGAFMLNGYIMSATLGSLVECTPFGEVKQIIEINKSTEIEDITYCNGKFYFAVLTMQPNKRHKVDIYVGDPNKDYQNSINTARLATLDYLKLTGGTLSGALKMANNTLIEGYKPDGHGVGMAKVSTSGNVELGDESVNTFVKGKELKHFDGTDSYTVITTKHYGTAIYKKKDIDDNFVKKSEVDQLGFPYSKVDDAKDWNTFTEQGAIEINFDGGANNPPRSHKQGMLIVMNFGKGKMIDQTFHAFNGETYHRMFMANTWKSWGRVQTSLNSRLKLWSANGGNEVYVE